MDNLQNLLERVKQYLLSLEGTQIYNSKDTPEEDFGNLEDNEHRIIYMNGFERSDPYMYIMYTTIRPIRFLITYDEDINNETNEITNRQLCFLLQTALEEDESFEKSKEYHYFVANYEDFNFEKVKEYYNNLLDKLPRNNFTILEEEIKDFFDNIK